MKANSNLNHSCRELLFHEGCANLTRLFGIREGAKDHYYVAHDPS